MGGKSKKAAHRILVADDSITIQKLVHITLAPSAYEVIAASDGADALVKIRNLKPDVALVACELPQLDGFQICEKVRQDPALESVKFVLLRTNAQKDAVTKGRAAGADDILLKPFDSAQLLRCLDIVKLKKHTVLKETAPREESVTVSLKEMVNSNPNLNQRLEEVALSVSESNLNRETFRVEPSHFNQPVDPGALGHAPTEEAMGMKAEAEIRAWIEKNLPALAEKLLKEEIAKIVSSS